MRKFEGGGLMVWDANFWCGKVELHFVQGKLNSVKYVEIIERALEPSIEAKYKTGGWPQQVGASSNTATDKNDCFTVIEQAVLDWPANSPDLSNIDNV